mgnify:CR=1 FL=1
MSGDMWVLVEAGVNLFAFGRVKSDFTYQRDVSFVLEHAVLFQSFRPLEDLARTGPWAETLARTRGRIWKRRL